MLITTVEGDLNDTFEWTGDRSRDAPRDARQGGRMDRKPLAVVLALAAVLALLAVPTPAATATLASPTSNRGWTVPSAAEIAALDR